MLDGVRVEERNFGRHRPKQLLKLLALQPHYQLHREQAMELLWPDSDPDAANNLNPDESEKSNLVQQFTAGSGQRAAARTLQRRGRRGVKESMCLMKAVVA